MEPLKKLIEQLTGRLKTLARGNAVVSKPISVADRHVLPLCELSFGFGGGGGIGETEEDGADGAPKGKGMGGGAGGGAKVTPVAVLVADGDDLRLETLDG